MVKIIVVVLMVFMVVYYIDIVVKIKKDEKEGNVRYKGCSLIIPFAYWIFPVRDKRKKRNVKSKTQKK